MRAVLLILLALAGLSFAAQAQERQRCSTMDKVKAALAEEYDEIPSAAGMMGDAAVILFSNAETKSFTLIILKGDGEVACPVLAGESWHDLPKGKSSEVRP
jgi:hypothetical protein